MMLDRTASHSQYGTVTARNEGADDYPAVVAQIDSQTRVIEGACHIQWIVQRKQGAAWRGVSFCRAKEALLRCVEAWAPGAHPALLALPDWFPEADA